MENETDRLDRRAVASACQYMGRVAWPTVIVGVVLGITYLAIVAMTVAGHLSLWLAVPLVSTQVYLSYTILHEAVHGSITGTNASLRWLNKALGYMAAWIVMIPFTAHRYEHMAHHRHANDAAKDPDFHVGNMDESLWAPLRAVLRGWVSQFSYYAKHRWVDAPPRQNLALCLEVAIAFLPRLGIIAAGFWVEGLALFVIAWLIGAVVLLFLFADIVHRPHEQTGRYVDTSTILLPGTLHTPLNWLWMYQNYHTIHHLFPRVPFYRYARLYEEIEDVLRAKGTPIYRATLRGLVSFEPRLVA